MDGVVEIILVAGIHQGSQRSGQGYERFWILIFLKQSDEYRIQYPQNKQQADCKNTLMLYMRMMFSMLVSLYTSRVVLNMLGVEDYGIYNVVGGFVAMFSLISNSLSASTGRF